MRKTCGGCRYWVREINGRGDPTPSGKCRRRAPVVLQFDLVADYGEPPQRHSATNWPGTTENEWCGEWEGRPTMTNDLVDEATRMKFEADYGPFDDSPAS